MVPVELLWRGMSLVVMLAALVPFRPSTVVHVIETTPHLARFLVGRQAFLLLDSEASACKHAPSLGISYTILVAGSATPAPALL